MPKTKRVKITVIGAGLSYKGEVDVSVAGQVIAWCVSESPVHTHVPPASGPSDFGSSSTPAIDLHESVSEYFNRYSPKRNPDKILTLACYLKQVRGQGTFTTKEIKGLFRDVGEILPANFKRDFSWASKRNAWISKEPGSKDGHYVTNTGAKALEAGFSKDVLDKTKITVRGRSRVKKISK